MSEMPSSFSGPGNQAMHEGSIDDRFVEMLGGSTGMTLEPTRNYFRSALTPFEPPVRPLALIPLPRDRDFVDRGDILDQIRQRCSEPAGRVALVGLGGVGKSQLAIEYAHRVSEEQPDAWVFWVHAGTQARVREGFKTIADAIKLPDRNQANADIPQLVSSWLSNDQNGKWTIVVDSADDRNILYGPISDETPDDRSFASYLPQNRNGSIVVTTRNRDMAFRLTGYHQNIIEVGPMAERDALTLLEKKLGSLPDLDVATDLVHELDLAPLAISQVAAYMRVRNISPAEYLDHFRASEGNRIKLLEHDAGDLRRDGGAPNAILTTWQRTFEHIRSDQPSAADLLSLMSFFGPQGIPAWVLHPSGIANDAMRQAREGDPGDRSSATISDTNDDDADEDMDGAFGHDVAMLMNYCLIVADETGGKFGMHRLVQLATRRWLGAFGQHEAFKQRYIERLAASFPTGEYENWATCRILFPHVHVALGYRPGRDTVETWATLLHNAGWYASSQGEYDIAERMVGEALKVREKRRGNEDLVTQETMLLLAAVLSHQGQWDKAEELGVLVMKTRKKTLGADHTITLTSISNLASTYWNQGRWKEAEELEVTVMETLKTVLGLYNPETLKSMSSLALTYWKQGRLVEAERLLTQVTEICKTMNGDQHPETLTRMDNLAAIYRDQGRLKESEKLSIQVIATRRMVLGAIHPDTLTSMDSVALIYTDQGRWEEAAGLHRQVVEARKAVLGAGHPNTLTTMDKLASIYRNQGRWKEVEDLEKQLGVDRSLRSRDKPFSQLGSVASRTYISDSGFVSGTAGTSQSRKRPQMQDTVDEEAGIIAEPASSGEDRQSQDASASIAETEYSLASSVLPERVGQYTSEMASLLEDAMPLGPLDASTLQGLEQQLPDTLKTFALMMGVSGSTPENREIMYFVYKHREAVIDMFRAKHAKNGGSNDGDFDDEEEEDRPRPVINHAQPMTHDDIMSRFLSDLDTTAGPEPELSSPDKAGETRRVSEDIANEELEPGDLPDVGDYRHRIVKSAAYEWLQRALSSVTTRTNAVPDLRKEIRDTVIRSLYTVGGERRLSRARPPERYRVTVEMKWDPRLFIAKQKYEEDPGVAVAGAVTLTGSAQDYQAATTEQYLSQIWPSSGRQTMQLLQRVLDGAPGDVQSTTWPDETIVTALADGPTFFISAMGLAPSIAEVIEQLAWLGAALQTSQQDQRVWYCTPSVKQLSLKGRPRQTPLECHCSFQINFEFEPGGHDEEKNGQCWHGMFRNPVVVRGYPLARRPATQTGLEMPLNMMARMVRATHVVPFGSSWYMKGFSSMLVLTALIDDTFLWHHAYNRDGARVSYFDHKPANPPTGIVTASALQNGRHVVGWCSDVKLYAGALGDSNLNIRGSGLDRPGATCVLEKLTITGGKYITGGATIAIGVRESPIHLGRDSYLNKMRWVSGQYAILWDEGDDRGWLVNGASALLHLVFATLEDDLKWMRNELPSDQILFKREDLKGPPVPHTPSSALKVLLNPENRALKIVIDDVESTDGAKDKAAGKTIYTRFKNVVEKQFSVLEQIMDHQIEIETSPGLDLRFRTRKSLEGWDFRDLAVVIKQSSIYARVKTLHTIAHGWVDFAREIKAITIFGKGFGEIIRPTDAESICRHWAQVPNGRYYLAACISDLKGILGSEDGHDRSENPISICNDLHWHAREDMFRPCQCGKTAMGKTKVRHSEDVAQVLAPSRMRFKRFRTSTIRTSNSVDLKDGGAVVFGYNSRFGLRWPDEGDRDPEEGEIHLETHQEVASDYRDSALGTSPVPTAADSCTSEVQAALQPDGTAETPAPSSARTRPLASNVAQETRAREPEENVEDRPLLPGQNNHSPAQVALSQTKTDNRDGGSSIGELGRSTPGRSAIASAIMTTSPFQSGPSVSGAGTQGGLGDSGGIGEPRTKRRERLSSVFTGSNPVAGLKGRVKELFRR